MMNLCQRDTHAAQNVTRCDAPAPGELLGATAPGDPIGELLETCWMNTTYSCVCGQPKVMHAAPGMTCLRVLILCVLMASWCPGGYRASGPGYTACVPAGMHQ